MYIDILYSLQSTVRSNCRAPSANISLMVMYLPFKNGYTHWTMHIQGLSEYQRKLVQETFSCIHKKEIQFLNYDKAVLLMAILYYNEIRRSGR